MRVLVLSLCRVLCAVACLAAPGVASAQCKQCNVFLQCVNGTSGARLCIEGAGTCTMFLPCLGAGSLESDPGLSGEADPLTTMTLFDAVPATSSPRVAQRLVAAGALAIGDDMRGAQPLGAIAEVALVHGGAFDAVFSDESGEGYAIVRTVQPDGVHLEVRAVQRDVVGARLAAETLGEHDRLSVPVRVGGRDRVLVLQTRDDRGRGDEGPQGSDRYELMESESNEPISTDPVSVALQSGTVTLSNLSGNLTAGVETGDLSGTELNCPEVEVGGQTGNKTLTFSSIPTKVQANTITGDVDIQVPASTYLLDLEAQTGEVDVQGITEDSQATSSITSYVQTGDIHLTGF